MGVVHLEESSLSGSSINTSNSTLNDQDLYIHSVIKGLIGNNQIFEIKNTWNELIRVENEPINFIFDTGAQVNIITRKLFEKINKRNVKLMKSKNLTLKAYGGNTLIM